MKTLPISGNDTIPAIGLGTWKSTPGEVGNAVSSALDIGYRHIDCASIYQNQKEIGAAFSQSLGDKIIQRDKLWVTSKLWNNAHAARHVRPALESTLRDLQLDYLDLFLIHWPVHFKENIVFPKHAEEFLHPDAIPVMETWQAMEKMVQKGLCRFIGVCNFNIRRLKELQQQAHIQPVMNQIELHPYLQQNEMLEYCRQNNILLTAYSPLGSPDRPAGLKKDNEPSLLTHPTIIEIANNRNISPGQLLISWGMARGTVLIPKSIDPGRQKENLEAGTLELNQMEIDEINKLEQNYRYVDGAFFQSPGSPYTVVDFWD